MSTVSDACLLLQSMFEDEWDTTTGGAVPVFTLEWFADNPERTGTDGRTKELRVISLQELSTVNIPASDGLDEVESSIQIDVWAERRAVATTMREEVKRIMRANASSPVTGVSFGYLSDWSDTTMMDGTDQTYRFTATLDLMYEEE